MLVCRCIASHPSLRVAVSIDSRGMIEYWSPDSYSASLDSYCGVTFKLKTETDLYHLAKAKTQPC